ncbi:hypothetical protein B0H10DRAFT_2233536 [Mycena sp. CBHHK59/15]|nr:hypothetical protein B0H10DRAFT_2233536 [Mycena sp. CBHHK59/15]
MKLVLTSSLLALLPLAVAVDFDWRVYRTGGCNHDAAPDNTYPPNSIGPNRGSSGQCINVPSGISWDHLEIDNSSLDVLVFCNGGCSGNALSNTGTYCNTCPQGCVIGSFYVF